MRRSCVQSSVTDCRARAEDHDRVVRVRRRIQVEARLARGRAAGTSVDGAVELMIEEESTPAERREAEHARALLTPCLQARFVRRRTWRMYFCRQKLPENPWSFIRSKNRRRAGDVPEGHLKEISKHYDLLRTFCGEFFSEAKSVINRMCTRRPPIVSLAFKYLRDNNVGVIESDKVNGVEVFLGVAELMAKRGEFEEVRMGKHSTNLSM